MKIIDSFRGDYFFLSNFYPCPLTFEGIQYPSSEHAFVAQKIKSPLCRQVLAQVSEPGAAKRMGRNLPIRKDWNDVRIPLMLMIVFTKFHNPEMSNRLLATGDAELIEGNWWHDNFWGNCKCVKCQRTEGQNHLGRILNITRFYLKEQRSK